MAEREPSAAQALFPHLPRGTPEPVERPERNESVAAAMWPSLAPKPQSRLSPDQLRAAWHEHLWALSGIRRKR